MTMYKKLLPFLNRFVYLRQGYFNRYYEGKLLEVTPDTLTMQSYDAHGRPESQWVVALSTITEFMMGDRDLDELNMRVSMAKTLEQAELDDESYRLLLAPEVLPSNSSCSLMEAPFPHTSSDSADPPQSGMQR